MIKIEQIGDVFVAVFKSGKQNLEMTYSAPTSLQAKSGLMKDINALQEELSDVTKSWIVTAVDELADMIKEKADLAGVDSSLIANHLMREVKKELPLDEIDQFIIALGEALEAKRPKYFVVIGGAEIKVEGESLADVISKYPEATSAGLL